MLIFYSSFGQKSLPIPIYIFIKFSTKKRQKAYFSKCQTNSFKAINVDLSVNIVCSLVESLLLCVRQSKEAFDLNRAGWFWMDGPLGAMRTLRLRQRDIWGEAERERDRRAVWGRTRGEV